MTDLEISTQLDVCNESEFHHLSSPAFRAPLVHWEAKGHTNGGLQNTVRLLCAEVLCHQSMEFHHTVATLIHCLMYRATLVPGADPGLSGASLRQLWRNSAPVRRGCRAVSEVPYVQCAHSTNGSHSRQRMAKGVRRPHLVQPHSCSSNSNAWRASCCCTSAAAAAPGDWPSPATSTRVLPSHVK